MRDDDEISDLAGTVKWVVASGASIAAAIVAGLNLSDLRSATASPHVAVTAAAGALVSVGLIVLVAAAVLATPKFTLRDLSGREARAGGPALKDPLDRYSDPLVQYIHERRTELLEPAASLFELYQQVRSSRDAETSRAQRQSTRDRARAVEVAARRFEAQRRYRRLIWTMRGAGTVFAASVITYAIATATGASVIDAPTRVRVYVPAESSVVPAACPRVIDGVATDGDWSRPVVVTEPAGPGCPALRFTAGSEYVVLPLLPSKP